jgi:hypothetical protein
MAFEELKETQRVIWGAGPFERLEPSWLREGAGGELFRVLAPFQAPPPPGTLEPGRREEPHDAFVEFFERYRTDDGIRQPRTYLIALGTRR